MELISPAQCRAARALLNWNQPKLAKKCDMHPQTISAFEKETGTPTKTTLEKIRVAFENMGVEFLKHDGVCKKEDLVITYQGKHYYERFLADAYKTLKHSKSEMLLSGGDESKAIFETDELIRQIIKSGTRVRQLIKNNETLIKGNLEDYRWMPDELFVNSDVKVIYEDYIAYLISWRNDEKVIVIKDQIIAEEARRNFNFIWNLSKPVTHSTSKIKY